MAIKVVIQSASPTAAESLAAELPKLLQAVAKNRASGSADAIQSLANSIKPEVNKDRIELVIGMQDVQTKSPVLMQLLSSIVDPLKSSEKIQRFKGLALAIHNYVDVHKTFPPSAKARNADGKSQLSWRVHILPYIGEQKLYSEFKLDEPWDSPHNKKLVERMPDIFSSSVGQLLGSKNLPLAIQHSWRQRARNNFWWRQASEI